MIERIKSALERCGISRWRINERVEETAELFFVKQQLDTRRTKDVHKYEVTVFRDVEAGEGDKPGRGFTSVQLVSSMDETQLEDELRKAYYAAQFAANPYFEMPDPVKAPMVEKTGELAEAPWPRARGRWPGPCSPPTPWRTPSSTPPRCSSCAAPTVLSRRRGRTWPTPTPR